MRKEEFNDLSLTDRYQLIKSDGEFIASRDLPLHRAHLFTVNQLTIELFIQKATNCIQWIEVQSNKAIIQEYMDQLDWKSDLGID